MSEEIIKTVIVRAVSDTEFRELLFDDPDKALAEYDLSDEEVAGLKGMQREKFDAQANELEERMSRAGIGGLSLTSLESSEMSASGHKLFLGLDIIGN